MSSMCDMAIEPVTKIILFVMFIFVIETGLGLGFRGPGDIL
jgi:predicted transporter